MIAGLASYMLSTVHVFLGALWGRVVALDFYLQNHFGRLGKYAVWAFVIFVVFVLAGHATKFTFQVVRYVLLPSAMLTVVLLMLMPCWAPMKTFPVFVAVSSVIALARSH